MSILIRAVELLWRHIKFVIALCLLGVVTFMALNATTAFSGWTSPYALQGGDSPSLLAHDDTLWLAVEKSIRMTIMHSGDGDWSSFDYPEELPRYYTEFHNPCWLKRPDGEVWLLWLEKSETPAHVGGIYSASLRDDGTLSAPSLIYLLDTERFSLCSVANTSDGGLAMMGHHFSKSSTQSPDQYAECTIHVADENLQWNTPVSMPWLRPVTETSHLSRSTCGDIFLDDQGMLWAVYTTYLPWKETFMRTSRDGTEWSEEYVVPVGMGKGFLQQHNGLYLLFFIERYRSVSMVYSEDGVNWSDPVSVTGKSPSYDLDVTESDDGTLWAVIDRGESLSVAKSTQNFQDRSQEQDSRRRNGIIAAEVVLLVGVSWIFVQRSSFYQNTRIRLKEIRSNKSERARVRRVEIMIGILCFAILTAFVPSCAILFAIFVFLTTYLIDYLLLKAENMYAAIIITAAFIIVLFVI